MFDFLKRKKGQKETDAGLGRVLGRALSSMPPDGVCPPPEDMAALSENRLARKERDRLLAHLATCERCRESYSLVCAMAPIDEPAAGREYGWQARRLVPLAAAAGIILAIVSVPLLINRDFKNSISETVAPYAEKPAGDIAAPASPAPAAKPAHPAESRASQATVDSRAKAFEPLKEEKKAELPAPEPKQEQAAEPVAAPLISSTSPAPAPPAPPAKTLPRGAAAGNTPADALTYEPKAEMTEAPAARKEARGLAAALPQAPPEPQERRNLGEAYSGGQPPLQRRKGIPVGDDDGAYLLARAATHRHKKIQMDEGQRQTLAKADAVTSEKEKIEALLRDLKLDAHEFQIKDVTKIIIKWSKPDNAGMENEKGQATVPADVSLGEGGVLTIVVLEENPGIKMRYRDRIDRRPAVGC